jgi:hypothetical protein
VEKIKKKRTAKTAFSFIWGYQSFSSGKVKNVSV